MKTYAVKNFITGSDVGYIDLGFTPELGDSIQVERGEETLYFKIADLKLAHNPITDTQGIIFGKGITKDEAGIIVREQLIKQLKFVESEDKPKSKGKVICRRHRPIPGMKDQIRYRVVEVFNSIDIAPETSYTLPELKGLMKLYPNLDFVFIGWERT